MAPLGHREFLSQLLTRLERSIDPDVLPWQARSQFSLLQIHFGRPRLHYEVQIETRWGIAEVGLHFEDEAAQNEAWAADFARRTLELRHLVGDDLELEEWTQSWRRLHIAVPLQPLDPSFAADLAERLASLIQATHQLVRSLSQPQAIDAQPFARRTPATVRRRWR